MKSERGMTLIEVLVAVLVLAIGLLGLAGLQMTGLKSNHSAYLRSQTTLLAYDLTDRMRVNRAAALDGYYDDCDEDLDGNDCENWMGSVPALLGAGATGNITRNGNRVRVCIEWDDSRGGIKNSSGETVGGFDCEGNDSDTRVAFMYVTEI